MTVEDKVGKFNNLLQSSFRNAMDAVESIHQTGAEIPIDILKELGYPEDKAEEIKETHRRILEIGYGGIRSAYRDLGDLVVQQFGELGKLAGEYARPTDSPAAGEKRAKAGKKSALAKPGSGAELVERRDWPEKSDRKKAAG